MSPSTPWWRPAYHTDRRPILLARNKIKRLVRNWFHEQDFVEVDTACLQISPGNETHLHAFRTELIGTDLGIGDYYLHTSPEFACKKLLAAGERNIFTFAPVFRNRERGSLHHPEFTMLEWYRADEPFKRVMADCIEILRIAAKTTGLETIQWRGRTCNPLAEPENLSVCEAFLRHAGINLQTTFDATTTDRDALYRAATAIGIACAEDDTWSDIFSRVLTAKVEPQLGMDHPVLLTDYPACEAALAQRKPDDERLAERFELYVCGVELANGFGELTNPAEQHARFRAAMDDKERIYNERYPIDEDFLAALETMPPASGCALGFDRVVMLATGAQRIDQVIWTPLPQ
ncbi:EF-P lysine aminoacylase EpmA [Filomicrobium insigne]|nr:EF-P lysine aminoacylase EpmA [Filomicrobium insigne]